MRLLCALTVASPALAAQPALTPVPDSERVWEVTCDIQTPEFAQGDPQEFAISLPCRSAASSVDSRSISIKPRPGQPDTKPVVMTVEGADSQPSRLIIVRGPGVAAQTPLQISFVARTWNTSIDEQIARSRKWPEASWPSDLMIYMQPDDLVHSEALQVRTFLTALFGADLRARPPYDLAKQIAAAAIDHCRHSPSKAADPSTPAESALRRIVMSRAASDEELPIFLCALYRAAGLPARVVWGVDVEDADSGNGQLCRRAWVEFLLPGEKGAPGEWIPVDIVRQRRISSRAPSAIPAWGWFGNNAALNQVIPFAAAPTVPVHRPDMPLQSLTPQCPTCPERAPSSHIEVKPSSAPSAQ